jgi:hypothetical protein
VSEDADLRAVLTYGDKQALGADIVTNRPALDQHRFWNLPSGLRRRSGGHPDDAFTQQLPTMTTRDSHERGWSTVRRRTSTTRRFPSRALRASICQPDDCGCRLWRQRDDQGRRGLYDRRCVRLRQPPAVLRLGRLQQFRVIGDTTADGTGAVAADPHVPGPDYPARLGFGWRYERQHGERDGH